MKDTIQEEDLYVDISKTELKRDINEKGKEIELLKEQLSGHDEKMAHMMDLIETMRRDRLAPDIQE